MLISSVGRYAETFSCESPITQDKPACLQSINEGVSQRQDKEVSGTVVVVAPSI